MPEPKNYLSGAFVYVKHFDNGGFVMNTNIVVDKFIEELQKIKGADGIAKVSWTENKNPVEGKPNGHCYQNTFTPKAAEVGSEGGKPVYEDTQPKVDLANIEF